MGRSGEALMANIRHDRQAIFQYIVQVKRNRDGNSPSMREIMEACGITSSSVMSHILDLLEKEGRIRRRRFGRSRSIEVVGGKWEFHG
jgi:SOS-response transcriptional repressor LexA